MRLSLLAASRNKRAPLFVSGILDTYPADIGISLRKLKASATNCLRVRRSSDNAEQDIGFTYSITYGGWWVDTVALLAFVGGGSGYVSILYDQSGNGRNFTSSNAGEQLRIVSSGVLHTEPRSDGSSRPILKQVDLSSVMYNTDVGFLKNTYGIGYYHLFRASNNSSTSCTLFRSFNNSSARTDLISSGSTDNQTLTVGARNLDGSTYRSALHQLATGKQLRQRTGYCTFPGYMYTYDQGSYIGASTLFGSQPFSDTDGFTSNVLMQGGNRLCVMGELIIFTGTSHAANRINIEDNQMAAWGTP